MVFAAAAHLWHNDGKKRQCIEAEHRQTSKNQSNQAAASSMRSCQNLPQHGECNSDVSLQKECLLSS